MKTRHSGVNGIGSHLWGAHTAHGGSRARPHRSNQASSTRVWRWPCPPACRNRQPRLRRKKDHAVVFCRCWASRRHPRSGRWLPRRRSRPTSPRILSCMACTPRRIVTCSSTRIGRTSVGPRAFRCAGSSGRIPARHSSCETSARSTNTDRRSRGFPQSSAGTSATWRPVSGRSKAAGGTVTWRGSPCGTFCIRCLPRRRCITWCAACVPQTETTSLQLGSF